ncbi:MAG: glycosyltransferase family 4 protein [Acidithiobacillus sp.]
MKIGHYVQSIISLDGMTVYVRKLLKAQKEAGHEVVLYVREISLEIPGFDGVDIKIVSSDKELYDSSLRDQMQCLHVHSYQPIGAHIFAKIPIVLTLHSPNFICLSQSMMLKNAKIPCPHVYHPVRCLYNHFYNHCGSIRPAKIYRAFKRITEERIEMSLMHVVAPSTYFRDAMLRSGFPNQQLHYVPHFVQVSAAPLPFAAVDAPKRFLFHGRLHPTKGVDILLQAASILGEDVFIDIAGSGHTYPEYLRMAKRLGISQRVVFHGQLGWEEIQELMQRSIAAVVPSIILETFCLSAAEAQACGRPVIASDAGGLKDIVVPGKTGYLIKPGDHQALALAMQRIIDDRAMTVQMGRNGWERMRDEFSLSTHLAQLESVYAAAAQEKAMGNRQLV